MVMEMTKKPIIYLDMDGVLANFHGAFEREITPQCEPTEIYEKGFYRNLKVNEGAREAVSKMLESGKFEVYIASKPATGSQYCAGEKYEWVKEHFPELHSRIILTPNKNVLQGHILIDDHPEKWRNFEGEVFRFNPHEPAKSWAQVERRLGL
jgi:5'(3')-deoxyribonucleotidase